MKSMTEFRGVRVILMELVIVALCAVFSPIVFAPTPAAADDSPFDLNSIDLGLSPTTSISAADGRTTLTLPIPDGTRATTFTANAIVPAGVWRGWLDVSVGDRLLSRTDVPEGATTVPVRVPLDSAVPEPPDSVIVLSLKSTMLPLDRYCSFIPLDTQLILRDQLVSYLGSPTAPSTIADFLPPVLQQFTVFISDQPTAEQSDAAISLTAAIVAHYGAQPVRIVLRSDRELSSAPPDRPFERSAAVRANSDGNTELIYPEEPAPPRLYITGTGTALLDQVRLVTSNLAALAVSTSASAGAGTPPPILAADSMTLTDLGISGPSATGITHVTVSVPLDQTRLGRAARNIRVHLIGTYTPLTANAGGSLSVSVGGRTIATWPAEADGVLDRWIDVPAAVLGRVTNLDVAFRAGSDLGCGNGPTVSLSIDSSTVVTSAASGAPTPPGFESLPQALLPQVPVALTEQDFANTARAVAIVAGLQRMSTGPLAPELVSATDLVGGNSSGILIAPNGNVPDGVELPLRTTEGSTLTFTDPHAAFEQAITLGSELRYGTLQVAYDQQANRTLLVATSVDAAEELDRALGWLSADTRRWYASKGEVLFVAPGREPVTLTSPAADSPTSATTPDSGKLSIGKVLLASVALLVVLAGGYLLLRRRRASA
ncbi:hypothetical protein [Antrihabitans stalactiti]|uniref:Cellulose biosynthesis cyclic di-GMP-binding regulatory protein BcsB n=1 Tax=Antrihabitans stalactiti TaxID=2584121 RepID=A0A848KAA8_9NOCA|nr:hypothetical protein [Antrihabitans stalactiti]NMN95835.1 cellulose biosynthesis cyclic di-GMP-binding regulatory protein BcsB [Antrihabitans stalactiti]